MRVLVTGGRGQLGSELQVVGTAAGHDVRALGRAECDITDAQSVARAVENARPDIVINCAAWNRVDDAEAEVDAAFRVNELGPRLLAEACASRSILLVHLSTDYVFDGSAVSPIDEAQATGPLSVYGRSKLAGEDAVRAIAPRHQVVRTSWLYGRAGPNFVLAIRRAAASAGTTLRVVSDQVGSPTWTGHLAPALLRLAARDVVGTFHLTNTGAVSRYELAAAVLELDGVDVAVTRVGTAEYPTAAVRPAYSALDNRAWRELGEPPLPHWRDGVAAYLQALRS